MSRCLAKVKQGIIGKFEVSDKAENISFGQRLNRNQTRLVWHYVSKRACMLTALKPIAIKLVYIFQEIRPDRPPQRRTLHP